MTSLPIRGSCFCQNVQFELKQAPTYACHCHCHSCQRASGAPFVTWVTFPAQSLRIRQGALAEHHSSPGVTRGHCSECGSSISYIHKDRPDDIDIAAACFNDSSFIQPESHIWLEDKVPWVEINDELPKFQQRAE